MRSGDRGGTSRKGRKMPAPDLDTIYKVRDAMEENTRNALIASGMESEKVFTRINCVGDFQKVRPRVELKAKVGAQLRHVALCPDFQERFDQWAFQFAAQVVTQPTN